MRKPRPRERSFFLKVAESGCDNDRDQHAVFSHNGGPRQDHTATLPSGRRSGLHCVTHILQGGDRGVFSFAHGPVPRWKRAGENGTWKLRGKRDSHPIHTKCQPRWPGQVLGTAWGAERAPPSQSTRSKRGWVETFPAKVRTRHGLVKGEHVSRDIREMKREENLQEGVGAGHGPRRL